MKWLGLMLPDHLDALRKMNKEDRTAPPKSKDLMSGDEISRILQQAYIRKRPVKLQANVLNNDNNYYPDLQCMVLGFQGNEIYFCLKNDRNTMYQINQIRNVKLSIADNFTSKCGRVYHL